MKPGKILIIDDEKDIRSLMNEIFSEEGYQVSMAANGQQARLAWQDSVPDIIFLDIWMPDVDGISLLKEMVEQGVLQHSAVIMMSGHGTIETAIEATKLGAYDFLEKPLSLGKLLAAAERAQNHIQLFQENRHLKQKLPEQRLPIGKSKIAQELRDTITRLSKYTMPILLTGESGTGKHHLAHSIHKLSDRKSQQELEINCLDFDEQIRFILGEKNPSDGSGHQKGELILADGGTLILSNIEAMPEQGQNMLFQILTQQTFFRLNSDTPTPINVRILALSKTGLDEAVKTGHFREDLAQKLNIMPIHLPALRQHTEDVPELVDYFSDFFMNHDGLEYREFPLPVKNILRQHSWPGNFRELKNLVQRLLIMGTGEVKEAEVKQALENISANEAAEQKIVDTSMNLKQAKESFEAAYLSQLLRETGGNVSETAKRSGVERTNLYRKLKNLGIDPKNPK